MACFLLPYDVAWTIEGTLNLRRPKRLLTHTDTCVPHSHKPTQLLELSERLSFLVLELQKCHGEHLVSTQLPSAAGEKLLFQRNGVSDKPGSHPLTPDSPWHWSLCRDSIPCALQVPRAPSPVPCRRPRPRPRIRDFSQQQVYFLCHHRGGRGGTAPLRLPRMFTWWSWACESGCWQLVGS